MRDFPAQISGPLGPWYKKVNAAVAGAFKASSAAQLLKILGEPDHVEGVSDDDRRPIGTIAIDPRYPAKVWIYVDPYRPRIRYRFGIARDKIVDRTQVTLVDR